MKPFYHFSPKKKGHLAEFFCFALIFLTALSYLFTVLFPATRAPGQALAVIFLFLVVQIANKFLLTEYRYVLEENTLSISSLQGKKIRNLGSLPITKESRLFTKEAWKKEKRNVSVTHRFSYCRNFFSPDAAVLLCPEEHGWVELTFEPDERMLSYLRQIIENS